MLGPSQAADAPSESGEAFPAVTVPASVRNTVFRPASFSAEDPARMPSSRTRSVPGTGVTSRS